MMNWCSKHDLFEICPECMRELQESRAVKPVAHSKSQQKRLEAMTGEPIELRPEGKSASTTGEQK